MSEDIKEAASRKASKATFLQTLSAVLWSFFGVRKGKSHSEDMQKLNPVHVIIVGLLAAAGFVIGLLVLVNFVVSSA
ncbi:DUF2970 domain-containing protein [Limnobacter sp. 130]|jgi:hypothetical protein|uniref:DUF2970 domain-containing protein n=1 Tax=Limnobacter sp. 130 TaxID=2653147 RepID=UPI0012F3A440|nr:DUF2970 domain-containing protein [Limnobacter sp. 130]VWX32627.1 putative transmembrane protein [Limnobacter sp. 130]